MTFTKKVFFADNMQATPFMSGRIERLLTDPRIEVVSKAEAADVIVSRRYSWLAEYFHIDGKAFYMWTHEPAWCTAAGPKVNDLITGRTIYVSTAHNGDVYLTPLYYFPFLPIDLSAQIALCRKKKKTCSILATYRDKFDRYLGDNNIDLTEYRQRVARDLQKKYKSCDICGRGWPKDIKVTEESRGVGWQLRKHDVMSDYKFNIALENTIAPNYVTEKIWQALKAACVPLAYGKSGLADVLRPTSFIDCSGLRTGDDVFRVISSLSEEDRVGFVRSAYEDYVSIAAKWTKAEILQGVVARFCDRVVDMV